MYYICKIWSNSFLNFFNLLFSRYCSAPKSIKNILVLIHKRFRVANDKLRHWFRFFMNYSSLILFAIQYCKIDFHSIKMAEFSNFHEFFAKRNIVFSNFSEQSYFSCPFLISINSFHSGSIVTITDGPILLEQLSNFSLTL